MSNVTAPSEVREAARLAYVDHEGCGTLAGHDAAADTAYAAGVAAGRRQAAADIRAETATFCMDGVGRHLVDTCARIAEGRTS